MPTYDYRCSECGCTMEVFQSFNEDKFTICPICSNETFERLISEPVFFVKGDPKTVEHQADRNSSKMGRRECEERELKAKERVDKAKVAKGHKVRDKAETPWWRDGSIPSLVKSDKALTKEQTDKYVKEMKQMGNTFKPNALPDKRKKNGK